MRKDVTHLNTDFGSMGSIITNLKVKMETSNDEKVLPVVDKPSSRTCKNQKKNPCLGGEFATMTVKKAVIEKVNIGENFGATGRRDIENEVINKLDHDNNQLWNRPHG